MKTNQLTKGCNRRVMYIENKHGKIDDFEAHVGWVTFSKSGNSVYYRDLILTKIKGGGVSGNFSDQETGDEYWISGIKKVGTNQHWAKSVKIHIDEDAAAEYQLIVAAGSEN